MIGSRAATLRSNDRPFAEASGSAIDAYKLSGDISRYGHRLEAFSGEFGAILSRQLEEKR